MSTRPQVFVIFGIREQRGTTFTKDFNFKYKVFVRYNYLKMSITYLEIIKRKLEHWYGFEMLWHVQGTSWHPNLNFK